jgi:hypothetical protein
LSNEKLTQIDPHTPEWWYNLAGLRVYLGKQTEGMKALRRAMEENAKRLAVDPTASDLQSRAATDEAFASIRSSPEFKQLIGPK